MSSPIHYSAEELLFIKNNCTLPRREEHKLFCEKFQRSDVNLDNFKGLCKRNGWLTGRTGCFKKGHAPHPDARMKNPNSTSFKKGHKPHNHVPVGTERIKADGYLWIKTAEPNIWRQKHLFLYEKDNGPMPKGFLLRFKDGDRFNFDPNNMLPVTCSTNMYLTHNNYDDMPKEVKPSIVCMSKLQAALSQKKCQNK